MADHPDVLIGTLKRVDPRTDVEVLLTGVDVKLTLRPATGDEVAVWLAPDEAIDLVAMLNRALTHED
jgi:hypothetical protein